MEGEREKEMVTDQTQKLMSLLVHVLMRDEKEERKKQARSNKQTRQSTCPIIWCVCW